MQRYMVRYLKIPGPDRKKEWEEKRFEASSVDEAHNFASDWFSSRTHLSEARQYELYAILTELH